jgi:hypothetical protein
MSREDRKQSALTAHDPSLAPGTVELNEAALVAVAGGLNPQPLPPGDETACIRER